MRNSVLFVLLTLSPLLFAKDRPWQNAEVAAVRDYYFVRGASTTYEISGYQKRSILHLTVGGSVRAYSDGKDLHVIDNAGKERKCPILREMATPIAEAFLAKEAAKTPEQLASEKAQRDAVQLEAQRQRQAVILQMLRNQNAQQKQKVEVQVKDCNANPALCIN